VTPIWLKPVEARYDTYLARAAKYALIERPLERGMNTRISR